MTSKFLMQSLEMQISVEIVSVHGKPLFFCIGRSWSVDKNIHKWAVFDVFTSFIKNYFTG